MKTMVRLVVCAWLTTAIATVLAQETWQGVLGGMPLGVPQSRITELNRTNCVPLMLNAFRSNAVVKALIFMPGATDELYFFRRANAKLTNANPSLLDAIVALTNQTYIQATFRPPLLLLHTTEDPLDVIAIIKNKSTAARLHSEAVPDRIVFIDADWDTVRGVLNKKLSVGLRPFANAPDSWHFFRHNFAAGGATGWEMLEAIALTDKTKFSVHWLTADFELDRRSGVVPEVDKLSAP